MNTAKSRTEKKPSKSERTRAKILDTAERMFSAQGVAGTSLRSLAAEMDVQAGTILHHFPGGKEQLFDHLVKDIFEQLLGQLSEVRESGEAPLKAVLNLISELWDYFEAHPRQAKIVIREAMEEHSESFQGGKFQAKLVSKLGSEFLQQAQDNGLLARVDPRSFLHSTASAVILYHAAPALKEMVLGEASSQEDKELFLQRASNELSVQESLPSS